MSIILYFDGMETAQVFSHAFQSTHSFLEQALADRIHVEGVYILFPEFKIYDNDIL